MAKVVFLKANASNFRRLLQSLLLRYTAENFSGYLISWSRDQDVVTLLVTLVTQGFRAYPWDKSLLLESRLGESVVFSESGSPAGQP